MQNVYIFITIRSNITHEVMFIFDLNTLSHNVLMSLILKKKNPLPQHSTCYSLKNKNRLQFRNNIQQTPHPK